MAAITAKPVAPADLPFMKAKHLPIDPSQLRLDDKALEFFRVTISDNDEVLKQRIMEVQREAYAKYPFPCIRLFHHVRLMMSEHPTYPEVLEAGKSGETTLIDIGCCMGTDVRKIAYDGYQASNIFGTDIIRTYLHLGHKLFDDFDTCGIHFLRADVFEMPVSFDEPPKESVPYSEVTELAQLRDSLTHIYTGAVFHLFDEPTQYAMALRLAILLKRQNGSIIFGRHEGFEREQRINDPPQWKTNRWGHSPASWALMWRKVFTEVEGPEFSETHVETEAFISSDFGGADESHLRPTRSMLIWSVRIV